MMCRPGASCFEKTPLSGSTIAFLSCRSTSPHASERGRLSTRPICSVPLSNNVLRLISTAQFRHPDASAKRGIIAIVKHISTEVVDVKRTTTTGVEHDRGNKVTLRGHRHRRGGAGGFPA